MPGISFGNADDQRSDHIGWFVGHFISPPGDLRSTAALEIKWGNHRAGEEKPIWTKAIEATTLAILIAGEFQYRFPDRTVVLARQGDYVLWLPGHLPYLAGGSGVGYPDHPLALPAGDVVTADSLQVLALEQGRNR